jgi:hypothetical protein
MNPPIQVKTTTLLLFTVLMLTCFALSPRAQAACQNGCLQNRNTVLGDDALMNVTSGISNTAVGNAALRNNTGGDYNTATGRLALSSNTNGGSNTATGMAALRDNSTGNSNTATGRDSLLKNTTGNHNTANGLNALRENTTGSSNTATGVGALSNNTMGDFNTANGLSALLRNTTGESNTATGLAALSNNATGSQNTANGLNALRENTTGDFNSAIGSGALITNTTGNSNNAIGFLALRNNTTGKFNIALGDNAGSGVMTADDVICIGHAVAGANVGGTCFIGNIRGVTTQNANALPVVIDRAGQLGTISSSQRFKRDIKPINKTSEAILSLNPVTFHYKSDNTGTPQFGLIAEEVAKVNPDLVVRDEKGDIYTVRYDAVNAMLLNEFLKEHRKVEEQEATIAQLKRDFGVTVAQLTARLDEQAAQIQKVSVQLEASKPAPQVVNNP